jgi:hypothetical protein
MSNEALINNRAFQNVWIAEKYQLSEVSSQIQKVLQNRGKDMGQLY